MAKENRRQAARLKRQRRIRKKITGNTQHPRLCVYRSLRHIYAQIIDDTQGITLVAASDIEKSVKDQSKFENKVDSAQHVGKLIAQRASEKKIKKVVFDRNGFLYHGRVKAVAEGAREAGLKF